MHFANRRLLVAFNAKTEAADADGSAEHHIPHVQVPTGLRRVVLFERRHVFHRENCRLPTVQLSVSTTILAQPLGRTRTPAAVRFRREKFRPRILAAAKNSADSSSVCVTIEIFPKVSGHLCESAYGTSIVGRRSSIGRLTVRRGHEQSRRFRGERATEGDDGTVRVV